MNYWNSFILFFLFLCFPQATFPNTMSYQVGKNGYFDSKELVVFNPFPARSYGDYLDVFDYNTRGLLAFASLQLPAGQYQLELRLTCKSFVQSGTVAIHYLNELRWDDPGETLDPPPADSNYPTWNYRNYNCCPWEAPGCSGSSEEGLLISERYVESATDLIVSDFVVIKPNQDAIGFLLKGSAKIYYYEKDTADTTPDRNPLLIMKRLKVPQIGGLNWNRFFNGFKFLR